MASGGLANRTIILAVGAIALVVSFLMNGVGSPASGFQGGQQLGYIVGVALVAMLIAWVALHYVLRRP